MAKALTARQQAALDKIHSQGSLDGIDRGMIQALQRKGALDGAEAQVEQAPQASRAQDAEDVALAGVLPDYTGRSWNSLSDLRDRIVADGREEIQSFDGITLVTDKRRYGLSYLGLTVRDA